MDVQLEGGLALPHHVLGAADNHPAVVVGGEIGQDEATLRVRRLHLPTVAKGCVSEQKRKNGGAQ